MISLKSANCFFVAYKNIALFNHPEQPKTATLNLRQDSCLYHISGDVSQTSLKLLQSKNVPLSTTNVSLNSQPLMT